MQVKKNMIGKTVYSKLLDRNILIQADKAVFYEKCGLLSVLEKEKKSGNAKSNKRNGKPNNNDSNGKSNFIESDLSSDTEGHPDTN